ncbi:MAG: hypothetical protein CMJ85_14380 [Planctomycetes bacterium]|nr:hypothetical protein [Planctomycetota bacterium]
MTTRITRWLMLAALVVSAGALPAQTFTHFESPQARPLAISADGQRLFVVNTPDHRLAVFSLAAPTTPVLIREIPVGIEPVSVAVRSKDEVWVVNHVSDSISVVSISRGVVIDTIAVADEPGDVVFAGSPQRAFVTSMTRREVIVIDPATRKQVGTVAVFGDDPRALLASADGKTVWVAITRSGNKTTVVPHTIAPLPPKPTNPTLPLAPKQGIIVRSDDPAWKAKLNVTLPDNDVVEIDVASLTVRRNYPGVGTTLFNLTWRPGTIELWVANTEARNLVRFEPALRGHAIDSRVTRITTGNRPTITPIDLNPGIDYTKFPNVPALSNALAQPTDVVFDPAGRVGYVAAFGTDRIGLIDGTGKVTGLIEVGNTSGAKVAPRTKRGPRGLLHHPTSGVLYVCNRLSNSVSVIDTAQKKVLREIRMFDPTPQTIREGRGFLFDAKLSGNGTMACAACHIDARHDGLAWDLGDPGGQLFNNGSDKLHPMKGPLLTRTLQGLAGERLFHWRADRPGLKTFNPTFPGLMGGPALGTADLATFVAYMQDIRFMPNPNRNRDDTLPTTPVGESAKDGETIFLTKDNVGKDRSIQFRCAECHVNSSGSGSFGFVGLIQQPMKAAPLRGLYQRNGRKPSTSGRTAGFGYGADGSKDDLSAFLSTTSRFNPLTTKEKNALERFLFAFPATAAPAVGFSRTVDVSNVAAAAADLLLLIAQAESGKCELIVTGFLDNRRVGFHYNTATKRFDRDRATLPSLDLAQIGTALAKVGSVLTFAGVQPGSGKRLGIDRDANGVLDGDEGRLGYGAPTPPCATVLTVDANSAPRVGNADFAIIGSGAPPRSAGWLLFGARRANVKFFDLDLLVDLGLGFIVPIAADACGDAVVPLPLPNDATWVGFQLRLQTLQLAPCGLLGAAASAGLELTLIK